MSHRITVLWTVPRSVSTSFERMMIERGDHTVFDEPFSRSYYYGPERRSDRFTESLPASSDSELLDMLEKAATERPVFVKDMAYHALGVLTMAGSTRRWSTLGGHAGSPRHERRRSHTRRRRLGSRATRAWPPPLACRPP